ncbi:hypothetical protein Tco_1188449 [Tanacetum coccineum]
MEKLDQMVKDFHLYEYNKGMETRKWSEDDKRRSKDFITAIEKRLQIRRIYRSLESFVGGRIRDIDYRLINRTTSKSENKGKVSTEMELVLEYTQQGSKDGDGDGNSQFLRCQFFTSAQDGTSIDYVRLCLGDDLKKAQDHSQRQAYIKEMLKKFGLEDSKPMKTPMSSDTKLTKDEESFQEAPKTLLLKHISYLFDTLKALRTLDYGIPKETGLKPSNMPTSIIGRLCGPKDTSVFQYHLSYSDEGEMFVEFVIQNQLFSYSLENFAQILGVPCEGACVFTDRWRLDELAYGVPSDGPYQTNPPSIEDIISSIRIDREGQVRRIRHEEEIDVLEYQVLTREIEPTLKPLEEIIRENVFCLGGNRDHVPACLCFMLYCVVHSEKFNLAYYMAKRMEWVTKQARLLLPYGMLLTRLFTFIMNENPELNNESYVLYDHVMTPFAAQLERKPRRDRGMRRGRHSTSSSSAFDQPSSSHLNDDDDNGNDEGTSRASTPSSIRYVNSLTDQVPQVFQNPPDIDPHLEPFYTG